MEPRRRRLALALIALFTLGSVAYITQLYWDTVLHTQILRRGYPKADCSSVSAVADGPPSEKPKTSCPAFAAPSAALRKITNEELSPYTYDQKLELMLSKLPEFLSIDDVAMIEAKLTHKVDERVSVGVSFSWGGILPSTYDVSRCPNCHFKPPYMGEVKTLATADAIMYYSCLTDTQVVRASQPLFCHCGEADFIYDGYWRPFCDVNMDAKGSLPPLLLPAEIICAFVLRSWPSRRRYWQPIRSFIHCIMLLGDLPTSWYRHTFALEPWNITSVSGYVRHLLKPPPVRDPTRVMAFIQSNCFNTRSGREYLVYALQRHQAADGVGAPAALPLFPFPLLTDHECQASAYTVVLDAYQRPQTMTDRKMAWSSAIESRWLNSASTTSPLPSRTLFTITTLQKRGNAIAKEIFLMKLFRMMMDRRWEAWVAQSVPVVFGNISAYWSRDSTPGDKAAIFVEDFSTADDLAQHLLDLAANRSKYLEYFAWQCKGIRKQFVRELFFGMQTHACRVCERVRLLSFPTAAIAPV